MKLMFSLKIQCKKIVEEIYNLNSPNSMKETEFTIKMLSLRNLQVQLALMLNFMKYLKNE